MKLKKAIKVPEKHNEWRLGAETKQTDPKTLTQAIVIILKANDLFQKYLKSGVIGDYEELKKL